MARKVALCRISDIEPLLSILPMLDRAGYDCVLPDRTLRDELRDMKCRNVDEFKDMHSRWGCEMPPSHLKEVGPSMMNSCHLYIDVNGQNGIIAQERYPNLKGRILCYFINGGDPRDTWDKGDNITPAYPIMTTARHYEGTLYCPGPHPNKEIFTSDNPPRPEGYWTNDNFKHPMQLSDPFDGHVINYLCPWGCGPLKPAPWLDKTYLFYPMFTRWDRIGDRPTNGRYDDPVSFVHNCMGWGCGHFVEPARKMGVKAYGGGNSPDKMVPHEKCLQILQSALCTVYLKGGGAVDYSILEPMAMGCPTTFHESYRYNTRLYDLLIPGETCLTWHDESSMAACIRQLEDPKENQRIGENGRKKMTELIWSANNTREIEEFTSFLNRCFP